MCVACRGRFSKSTLLRWVVNEEGIALPDPAARHPGRGCYVCRSTRCWEALRTRRRRDAIDFESEAQAFRLAIHKGVVQNVAGEMGENGSR